MENCCSKEKKLVENFVTNSLPKRRELLGRNSDWSLGHDRLYFLTIFLTTQDVDNSLTIIEIVVERLKYLPSTKLV